MTDSIKLIVVDLDGTLLNDKHELSERNEKALRAAMEKEVQVVLATGKTRGSALSLIARLNLTTPGIYLQGLATYNNDGTIRHQLTLDPALARRVITFAEDRGFSVVAYNEANILVRSRNRDTDVLMKYGEPEPQVVGPLQNILGKTPINKVLMVKLDEAKRIRALRWQLDKQIDGSGRLVQAAIEEMLEVVPRGGSKGAALKTLLKEMNLTAANVLAIGDGENDIEMLKTAGIGVAVENAQPKVKEVADHVVASNEADGVAEAIERFVLDTDAAPLTEAGEEGQEKVSESETL